MAHDKAYNSAEKLIEEAHSSGATGLHLERMRLTELPESLGQLKQLQTLHLSYNQLTALPRSLRCLSSLNHLIMWGNEALGVPLEVLSKNEAPAEILDNYFSTRKAQG